MLTLSSERSRPVSTSLLISTVALPVSVIAFVVLYENNDSLWGVIWLTTILPAIWLSAAILTTADILRGRSWKQVALALTLLSPTVFLTVTAVSTRFALHQLFTFRALDWHLPVNGFVLMEKFEVCEQGQTCKSHSLVKRTRNFRLAKVPDGCCSLAVINGHANKDEVDSLRIALNGKDVALVAQKALVTLQADNEISVQLTGPPDSYVHVIVAYTGKKDSPPN